MAGRDIRNVGTHCPSQPGSYQHGAVSLFTFHQQRARDQELLGKQWELVSAAIGVSRPFPVTLPWGPSRWELGFRDAQTPRNVGWVSGDLVTLGCCPQSAGIPWDCRALIPTHQDPQPEEDPAGHGQGGVPVLRRRQDDPKADVDDPREDVDGLGKDEGGGSRCCRCRTRPTPIPGQSLQIPGRPWLTPNTLGRALWNARVWSEVLAGAGAWELRASWAARGSVAGISSVMILTLPASVTVVAAMARGAEGIPSGCLPPPPLPPQHGPCAVQNPRPGRAGLPLPFAPCRELAHGILARPLLLNEAALPAEPPKILHGNREGGTGNGSRGSAALGRDAPRPPFPGPFHPELWMLRLGIIPAINVVPNEVFITQPCPLPRRNLD